jgi:1,4-dihydroxy-2-naphthoate octaprenyltransferase
MNLTDMSSRTTKINKEIQMNKLKLILGIIRLPFLVLAPACVAVGIGTAYWQTHQINWLHIILVLIGGVSAHASVNAFNECFDFKSGLDSKTQRTPFSGGSGTLPAHPEMARIASLVSWSTFAITGVIGLYFVWLQGWQLLPVGILGLILLVTYTIWWAFHPILCLIAPGLGFGILMVMGTHFAMTGTYSWSAFVASLVPTFLVSDLLLLNQFPDADVDQTVGRKHYPIVVGRKTSSLLYGSFLLLANLSVVIGVLLRLLPATSLISLLTAILAWRVYRDVKKNAENIPALIPSMGMNVIINISMPVLLALGLFIGK